MPNCVFCNFSKIGERTIATIEGFYVVATLGQITNGGNLLLIPIKHSSCIGTLNKNQISTLDSVLQETISILDSEYNNGVTFFEHGIVGQTIHHSHLHLLPSKIDLSKKIRNDFPKSKVQTINSFNQLKDLYTKQNNPYLLWSSPSGKKMICWNPPAPPEYLRTITANILGVPERASWRRMDPVLDNRLAEDTLDRLTPLFNP